MEDILYIYRVLIVIVVFCPLFLLAARVVYRDIKRERTEYRKKRRKFLDAITTGRGAIGPEPVVSEPFDPPPFSISTKNRISKVVGHEPEGTVGVSVHKGPRSVGWRSDPFDLGFDRITVTAEEIRNAARSIPPDKYYVKEETTTISGGTMSQTFVIDAVGLKEVDFFDGESRMVGVPMPLAVKVIDNRIFSVTKGGLPIDIRNLSVEDSAAILSVTGIDSYAQVLKEAFR